MAKRKSIIILTLIIIISTLFACSANKSAKLISETQQSNSITTENSANSLDNSSINSSNESLSTKPSKNENSSLDASVSASSSTTIIVEMHNSNSQTKGTITNSSNQTPTIKSTTNSTTKHTTSKADANSSTSKATKPSASGTTSLTTSTHSTTVQANYCTITIECKTILNNMDKLKAGHASFVPSDGYILNEYTYYYKDNESVYDALNNVCEAKNIKLTAESSIYGAYIVGINNIDQFDCGTQSGWLYSVNSKFPPVSCNKYNINNKDNIIFSYTC